MKVPNGDYYQQIYKQVHDILGLTEYYCEPYGWSSGIDLIHENVRQPFGLNLTNLEKNLPIVLCENKKNKKNIDFISFLGIYPGYYKMTEKLKLKRPFVYLQLTKGEWIISLVGQLIACGKVHTDDVVVLFDQKTKSTQIRMAAQYAITLLARCIIPPANSDHLRLSKLARYVKPSNNTTLNVVFDGNQTLTNFQDRQLKFNFKGKIHHLEESLTISKRFWMNETIVPEDASKDFINALYLYPGMSRFHNFFVDCVDFTKVFTFHRAD